MASGKIFINYRREDAGGYARSLFDRINAQFPGHVFMDVGGSIEFGLDFAEEIRKAVGSCDALVVLIGRHWLGVRDVSGRRRLDDPGDFLGLEISTALKRGVRVIPALVGGASMPSEEDLPPELKPLSRRQAVLLSDQDWDHTVERLIKTLEGALRAAASAIPKKSARLERKKLLLAAVGGGTLAALLLAGALVYRVKGRQPTAPSPPNSSHPPVTASPLPSLKNGLAAASDNATVPAPQRTPDFGSVTQSAMVRPATTPPRQRGARRAPDPTAGRTAVPVAESFDTLVVDGDVAYQRNEYQNALDKYLRAYRMRSDDPGVRRRIATTLTLLGRPEEAQKYQ